MNLGHYFFLKIFFFMRDTQREAETQAEGEAGSLQGSPMWDSSRTPGSHREPKADAQLLSHPGVPALLLDNRFVACKGPMAQGLLLSGASSGLLLSGASSFSPQGCLPCPIAHPQSPSRLPTSGPMAIATVFSRSGWAAQCSKPEVICRGQRDRT